MQVDSGDTSHLHIEFFVEAVEDQAASRKEGRPIYKDTEMVRIKFVGDPKKELVAPANDKFIRDRGTNQWVTYAEAYARHYEHFMKGKKLVGDGFTPLEELPFLNAAQRAELKALNVHSAEALAQLEGPALGRLGMFGRQKKDQATSWLAKARDSALETKLSAENSELRSRLEMLEKMMQTGQRPDEAAGANADERPGADSGEIPNTPFNLWPDDALKTFVKDKTGTAPRGNPSHTTLVRMAEEAFAKEAA